MGPESEQLLMVVTSAGRGLALDQDRCIEILRECGFLPTGPVGVVNLGQIPDGLSAEELERFLREDGADISVSAVLKIMVGQKAGLRKRTRRDEDDRQAAAQAGGEARASARN